MLPNIGPMEMMLIMGLGVLLFGKRLPEVGRSLGRGIVEFKKGLNGVTDDLDVSSSSNRYSSGYGSSHRSEEPAAGELGLLGRVRPEVRAARHRVELEYQRCRFGVEPAPVPQMEYPPATSQD